MSEHVLWVERYRPKTVDECILPERIKAVAKRFVESGTMPNALFSGGAGTGKTTLAKALCNELGYDWIIINGSNEGRLMDTLRTRVTQFASTMSMESERKCVILDEFDHSTPDVQAALRNFIEQFSSNCSFIITCNFPNRIIEPLHSRCSNVDFAIKAAERPEMIKQMFTRVSSILAENSVTFDKKVVGEIVKKHFPDFRRTINELQRYSVVGTIDTGALADQGVDDIKTIVGHLKEKNFGEMRKWVATCPNFDMASFCRKLYNTMYDYCKPESMPELILILADSQYKDAFVADKEINAVAMMTQIMMQVEFK